jgi:hypothetical protein
MSKLRDENGKKLRKGYEFDKETKRAEPIVRSKINHALISWRELPSANGRKVSNDTVDQDDWDRIQGLRKQRQGSKNVTSSAKKLNREIFEFLLNMMYKK